jgi:glycosyltransferase involved in cell wall biosynthesis
LKKIFFFISSLAYGGKERQTIEMLKLLAVNYKITLYVLNQKNNDFSDESILNNIELKLICKNSKSPLKRFWQFLRIIIDNTPDLIHTMDAITTYFCLIPARLIRVPVINGSIRHAGVTRGLDYYFEKISLLLSDYIISNSHAGLVHYNLSQSRKAIHIYNFIDSSRFIISTRSVTDVVMTANFTAYKDHNTALICTEKLISEGRINKLHLIGTGPNLSNSIKWVSERKLQDHIVFWGKVSKVGEVLSYCSIGIMCSTKKYREGISNSILEYMGSGLLAIASDIGATSEIIDHKNNGLLFEVEDPESLYKTIVWALDNPEECTQLVKNGLETVKSKFSPQINCTLLQDVYRKFV